MVGLSEDLQTRLDQADEDLAIEQAEEVAYIASCVAPMLPELFTRDGDPADRYGLVETILTSAARVPDPGDL